MASLVDGKLHVCGGRVRGEDQSSCYALQGTSWEVQSSLSVTRWHSAGSSWMGGWLVTGGFDGSSDLYRGGVWSSGPSLNTATSRHCQVTVGRRVIVAG